MVTELGKIAAVRCGIGGYQDAMLGISFVFSGEAWGVQSPFYGAWCPGLIKINDRTEWTEQDRDRQFAEAFRKIGEVLQDAKKDDVSKLVGVPVECTFDDNRSLHSWRILKEVL